MILSQNVIEFCDSGASSVLSSQQKEARRAHYFLGGQPLLQPGPSHSSGRDVTPDMDTPLSICLILPRNETGARITAVIYFQETQACSELTPAPTLQPSVYRVNVTSIPWRLEVRFGLFVWWVGFDFSVLFCFNLKSIVQEST